MAPRALEFSLEDAEKLMKLRANGQLMKDAFVIFNRARKEAGKQDFSVGTFQRIWKSIRETQKTFGTAEAHWKTIMEALCAQDNCVSCKNISEEIRAALSNASQQLFAMQQKNGKFMYDRKDFEDFLPSNLSFANTNAIDDSRIESESHSHHAYVCDGLNQKSSNRLSNNGDTLDQSDIMIGQTIGAPNTRGSPMSATNDVRCDVSQQAFDFLHASFGSPQSEAEYPSGDHESAQIGETGRKHSENLTFDDDLDDQTIPKQRSLVSNEQWPLRAARHTSNRQKITMGDITAKSDDPSVRTVSSKLNGDDQSVGTIPKIQLRHRNDGQTDRNMNDENRSVQTVPKTQIKYGQGNSKSIRDDQSMQTVSSKLNGDDQSVRTIPKIQLRHRNDGQTDRNMNDENRSVQTVPKTQIKYGQGNSKSFRDDQSVQTVSSKLNGDEKTYIRFSNETCAADDVNISIDKRQASMTMGKIIEKSRDLLACLFYTTILDEVQIQYELVDFEPDTTTGSNKMTADTFKAMSVKDLCKKVSPLQPIRIKIVFLRRVKP